VIALLLTAQTFKLLGAKEYRMFICLEGIDGAGKSTQSRLLRDYLERAGYAVELVCDPGTTKLGKAIRQLILDCDDPISPVAQMLLFSSARAELSAYIQQKIAGGKIVICDRWILSTLVYQATLNHVSEDLVMRIFNATSTLPDLCILLDIDPTAADRRKAEELRKDRYERISLAEKLAMRDAYLAYADKQVCAKGIRVIAADAPQEVVHGSIVAAVISQIGLNMEAVCAQNS
jgi:dTMP kinase